MLSIKQLPPRDLSPPPLPPRLWARSEQNNDDVAVAVSTSVNSAENRENGITGRINTGTLCDTGSEF